MYKVTQPRTKQCLPKKAYRYFFENYYELQENRKQLRQLRKLKYVEIFNEDSEVKLGGKSETLKWLVEPIPKLEKIELCLIEIVNHRKDILRLHQLRLDLELIHTELSVFEKSWKQRILVALLSQHCVTNWKNSFRSRTRNNQKLMHF